MSGAWVCDCGWANRDRPVCGKCGRARGHDRGCGLYGDAECTCYKRENSMTDFERFGWDNAIYLAVRNAAVAGLTREQILRTVDDAIRGIGRRYHAAPDLADKIDELQPDAPVDRLGKREMYRRPSRRTA